MAGSALRSCSLSNAIRRQLLCEAASFAITTNPLEHPSRSDCVLSSQGDIRVTLMSPEVLPAAKPSGRQMVARQQAWPPFM